MHWIKAECILLLMFVRMPIRRVQRGARAQFCTCVATFGIVLRRSICRPNEEGVDAAIASVLDTFKATYGGDQEDDMPVAGAKRAAGGGVRMDNLSRRLCWAMYYTLL